MQSGQLSNEVSGKKAVTLWLRRSWWNLRSSMGLHKVSDLSVVLNEVFIINFLLCGLHSNYAALHQALGLQTIQHLVMLLKQVPLLGPIQFDQRHV